MPFPTTGLLDDFNRADEDPLANGTWSGPVRSGQAQCEVNTNQVSGNTGTNGSYWSVASFGPDMEAYIDVPVKAGSGDHEYLYARCANFGLTTFSGYRVIVISRPADLDDWFLTRFDNNVSTTLVGPTAQTFLAGDSFGIECIGSVIKSYRKTGGTWTQIQSVTDTTYNAVSQIGLGGITTVYRLDNFSGGTVVAAGVGRVGHGALLSGFRNQVIQRV